MWASAASEAHAAPPRYRTKAGVRLSPEVKEKLADIAERYYTATKRTLLVTSGTRTPREQAEAMYGKLRAGDRLWIYRDQASVRPIRDAYDTGRRKRWKRARVIDAMTDIIAGQVERGIFISRHLRAHAFDVRCYDMSGKQKRAFRAAVEAVGHVRAIEEKRPPHFHCEVRIPRAPSEPVDDGGDGADGGDEDGDGGTDAGGDDAGPTTPGDDAGGG